MLTRVATDSQHDLNWIRTQAKLGTYELGFLPTAAYERYVQSECLFLLEAEKELLAFCVITSAKGRLRIFQMWTRKDVRRQYFARTLLEEVLVLKRKQHERLCSCWCAEGLEALEFWSAMEFQPVARREGGTDRGRMQIMFERRLDRDQALLWKDVVEPRPLNELEIRPPSPLRGRRIIGSSARPIVSATSPSPASTNE